MSRHWQPPTARRTRSRQRGRRSTGFSWDEIRLMTLGGVFLGLGYVFIPAHEAALPSSLPGTEYAAAAASVRVIDGDTFDYAGERIRIADIDTPEVDGRCAYETQLAARATDRLEELLGAGAFELQSIDRDTDKYGRKLRIVTREGRSIGDQMVSEGLARTWTGRREPWC